MSGNDLEVYIYRGNDGEEVPETVEKLIVEKGVQILPESLCQNYQCLREVTLPLGLKTIGSDAFVDCPHLQKVEFAESSSSSSSSSPPNPLQSLGDGAFQDCSSLTRINLPPFAIFRGSAFQRCMNLIEANLSTTIVIELPMFTFLGCISLQTVSLPKSLRRIGVWAFAACSGLVAVAIPLDSHPIRITSDSFVNCKSLANIQLPQDSEGDTGESPFGDCNLLQERYGEDSDLDGACIVTGLTRRFENFAIHRMCYDHSAITTQELRQCIAKQQRGGSLVDGFGMTPFHILFSTIDPRVELLEVLLESLPTRLLRSKDANERRPVDYLIRNWTTGTKSLLLTTLQIWMIGPLAGWGDRKWSQKMKAKLGELLCEEEKERRLTLFNEMYSTFEKYEKIESTSILELALWRGKLKSGKNNDGTKRRALDRVESRCVCGSDVVVPNVTAFM